MMNPASDVTFFRAGVQLMKSKVCTLTHIYFISTSPLIAHQVLIVFFFSRDIIVDSGDVITITILPCDIFNQMTK